jgi:hypothetical protein
VASTAKAFARSVRALGKGIPREEIADFQRLVSLDALRSVVLKTPVDTGFHRGAWQLGVGKIPGEGSGGLDPDGDATIAEQGAGLAGLPPFSVVWLANNGVAIEVLEDGLFDPEDPGPSSDKRPGREGETLVEGGFSVQAREGMVKVTVVELAEKYK